MRTGKNDIVEPLLMGVVVFLLLASRLVAWRKPILPPR
jgi:hypothetical protein